MSARGDAAATCGALGGLVAGAGRRAWWAGLGALSAVESGASRAVASLADRGRERDASPPQPVTETVRAARTTALAARYGLVALAGLARSATHAALRTGLHGLGLPTRRDVEALGQRIDGLAAQVDRITTRR
jgi:poly(hydroxyalkanoate) granule-associated protein